MNLLDKYILEVGRHLPAKGRLDLEAEIRSTLQDMIDDRSRETGQPIDDALVSAVLKDYGAPTKVAAAYKPVQYLIGPRLYPVFELVVKIALAAVGAIAIALLVFDLVVNPSGPAFGAALERFADLTFGGVFSLLGNIVLGFAILERVLRNTDFEQKEKEWDPADLSRVPDPEAVKRFELILTVVFTVIGLSVANLQAAKFTLDFTVEGQTVLVPVLSSAFFNYLPWMNVLGVAEIIFSLFMVSQPVWRTSTRLVDIVINGAQMTLAMVMVAGPALVTLSPAAIAGTPFADNVNMILRYANLGAMIALSIVVVISIIEIGQGLYKLLTPRKSLAFPTVK